MLFDTHTHVNFNAFKNDWREVVNRALKNDVWLVNAGSNIETSFRAVKIAESYKEGVYAAVGLHPIHVDDEDFDEKQYWELAKNEKVVAIGECGLDYYHNQEIQNSELRIKNLQKEIFIKHIELAHKIGKPLMIHCREAFNDLIKILGSQSSILNSLPGAVHFFTGTKENAKTLLEMGFYFTFGGLITFNRDFDEIIKFIPLEKIMLETDAPYVSPAPYRGKRNEPLYIIETAKKLAEIKGVSLKEISAKTTGNATVVFGLKI